MTQNPSEHDCQSCAAKDQIIEQLQLLVGQLSTALTRVYTPPTPYTVPGQNTPFWDSSKCPCSPSRGGNGVCNCIMGGAQITCMGGSYGNSTGLSSGEARPAAD